MIRWGYDGANRVILQYSMADTNGTYDAGSYATWAYAQYNYDAAQKSGTHY